MKYTNYALGMVLALSILFIGCESVVDQNLEESETLSIESLTDDAHMGMGAVPIANGSGHFTIDEVLRTFSFNTSEKKDGTITGMFNLQARQNDSHLRGDVTCVNVLDDNRVIIAGFLTKVDESGFRIGGNFAFLVEDNGAGSGAEPDRLSLVSQFNIQPGFPTDQSIVDFFCTQPFAANSLSTPAEVEKGNITVH